MAFLLPIVALVLAVVSRFAVKEREPGLTHNDGGRIFATTFVALVTGLVARRFGPTSEAPAQDLGLAIAIVAGFLSAYSGNRIAAFSVGISAAAALHLLPSASLSSSQLAAMCGVGLASLVLGNSLVSVGGLAVVTVVAADNLIARNLEVASAPWLGSVIAISGIVGAILAVQLTGRLKPAQPFVIGLALLIGGLAGTRDVSEKSLGMILVIAAAAAIASHWLLVEEGADLVRIGLAAIISVAVATVAFGLDRGAGMAVALLAMVAILVAVENKRALLAQGPLLGLVLYRILRESHPDLTRALDIGQHYAMLGVLLGAIVPLLPVDAPRKSDWKGVVATALWAVVTVVFPALVILMFGSKGAIGFVIGLGLTSFVQAIRSKVDLLPLAVAGGLSATTIILLGWTSAFSGQSRDDKIRIFEVAVGGFAGVAVLLAFLSRGQVGASEEPPAVIR